MEDTLLKNLNVLYVEDDFSTQEIITQILKVYFAKIHTAQNGFDAYEIYKNEQIDMIITDLEMPKMDGISFISEIRKIDFHLPIIVFTAYTDKEHLLPCANYNIQGYIEKPITYEKLKDVFKNILTYIETEKITTIILSEDIIYDIDNCKIIKNGMDIHLSKKEKLFLDLLIANKSKLVTYEQIEYILWEKEGESMSNMALRTLVKGLRQKLDKSMIENISRMGYVIRIK